jgi:hydrogenase maturation protein HypF
LSHHIGDLGSLAAIQALDQDVRSYEELFGCQPSCVACDLHPDYASTSYAERRAAEGLEVIAVQHHHAHMASCMAENQLTRPVLGIIWDGTGLGLDGAIWGGEFLVGDYGSFSRAAHFRYVALPGGEQAIREPWRMALSHLLDAEVAVDRFLARHDPKHRRVVETMIQKRIHCPRVSSVGRLFDAVASLIAVQARVSFDGQGAMELESLASAFQAEGHYSFAIEESAWPQTSGLPQPSIVDTRPIVRDIVQDITAQAEPGRIARRFHSTLVEIAIEVCRRVRATFAINDVVMSGGVFANALLQDEIETRLRNEDFNVYRHRVVPAGDGGLCLGQLMVANARRQVGAKRELEISAI